MTKFVQIVLNVANDKALAVSTKETPELSPEKLPSAFELGVDVIDRRDGKITRYKGEDVLSVGDVVIEPAKLQNKPIETLSEDYSWRIADGENLK